MFTIYLIVVCFCTHTLAYLVSIGKEPVCSFMQCKNGVLDPGTCTCNCSEPYYGHLCEKERKASSWPDAEFAMPESMFGCPEEEDRGWSRGFINMSLPADYEVQIWNDENGISTEEKVMLGPFYYRALQMNFCVKKPMNISADDASGPSSNQSSWGDGNYCIYQAGRTCPTGFRNGNITIKGYNIRKSDTGGALPMVDIRNDSSVVLLFCCREDQQPESPISLPSKFPFHLFKGPSASECQQVQGMVAYKHTFYMNNQNSSWEFEGLLPIMDNTTHGQLVGLPFCYYEPFERRECYYSDDGGKSYNGRRNKTASGKPCLVWTNVSSTFEDSSRWYGEFELNYCRTYAESPFYLQKPVCIVSLDKTEEFCDVPKCPNDDPEIKPYGFNKPFYSVTFNSNDPPEYAVDGLFEYGRDFTNTRPMQKPWFQIDLQEHIEVHAIVIYRSKRWFPVNARFVGTYVSVNQWDFLNYGAYRCDDRRNLRRAKSFRFQCKRPVVGQYVSVRNFDHTDPYENDGRFHYLSIQEIVVIGKPTKCGRPLGMISGNINDYQIQASSARDYVVPKPLYFKARVLRPGEGWCAHHSDSDPWLMVDLIVPTKVQGILMQGWLQGQESLFIETFTLFYGSKKDQLRNYEDPPGYIKTFHIDQSLSLSAIQRFMLTEEILARYIKIVPATKAGEVVCLKTEIIGCQKHLTRDIRCRPGAIDFGFEEMIYHSFWIYEDMSTANALYNISGPDVCPPYCLEKNCTSYSVTLYANERTCVLHDAHRYQPDYKSAWVTDQTILNLVGQRLCFKDYSEIDACNRVLQIKPEEELTVASPGAPFSYGQGINCTWELITDQPMFVKIEFVVINLAKSTSLAELRQNGVFDYNPGACVDTVTVYSSEDNTIIDFNNQDQYTGSVLISTSNKLFIRLQSCFHSVKQEMTYFQATASTVDTPGCGIDSYGCVATCTQPSAYIANDRYPAKYQSGDSCVWKIEGDFGQIVELEILSIDVIDDDDLCTKSYVAVYDVNPTGQETLLGRFCKQNRIYSTLSSSWQKMRVEFRAGNSETGWGFLGKYKLVTFTQSYENITSDDCGPGWYYYMGSCYEFHKGRNESAMSLTWLEAERACQDDGGHLVSIASRAELSFVHYLLTTVWDTEGDSDVYIGLHKETEGKSVSNYRWSDGSPLTFTAWYRDSETGMAQPNGLTNERCTQVQLSSIRSADDWHDTPCAYDKIFNYICERTLETPNIDSIFDDLAETTSVTVLNTNTHQCNNSEIILKSSVCDSQIDCMDGSDEDNCGGACSSSQFRCTDGQCISLSLYCDFIPHCSDSSDEMPCQWPNCSSSEWQCNNKQCIPQSMRCDLHYDCFDGSDESNCETCAEPNFQCYDQTCISKSVVCDGYVDCSGFFAEDENQNCKRNSQKSCAEWWSLGKRESGEYLINMGNKDIAPSKVECVFSHEGDSYKIKTIVHHNHEETLLAYMQRIDEQLLYDAHEQHIESLKETSTCTQSMRLRCHYLQYEQDAEWWANNGDNFHTSSDVIDPKCSCPFVNQCMPGKTVCNCNTTYDAWYSADVNEVWEDSGVIDDEDLLPVKSVYAGNPGDVDRYLKIDVGPLLCVDGMPRISDVFLCRGGKTIDSSEKCLMDYDHYYQIIGCRDLSHLENCEDFECPQNFAKCNDSFCVAARLVCDGVPHCRYGEDEQNCRNKVCAGFYRCKNSDICIEQERVCDGIKNCPNHDDELLCGITCPDNCTCDGLLLTCDQAEMLNASMIPRNVRKLNLSSSDFSQSMITLEQFSFLSELYLSRCDISVLTVDTFNDLRNLMYLDLSFNKISRLAAYTFHDLVNLRQLNLDGNYFLEFIDPQAFFGLAKVPDVRISATKLKSLGEGTFSGLDYMINLNLSFNSISSVKDKTFLNLAHLQTLDIRSNDIQTFSKDIFYGLSSLKALYTDAYMFCCLKPETVTDENCLPREDEFSSCDDLMRNDTLRWFLWIIGFCALVGNLGVLLFKCTFDRQTLRKSHGILITNLGIADFLMGVYLLIIASADIHYRGRYIWNDATWRNGAICKFAGILATLSSETSVLTLSLITLDRLLAVRFPFGQFRFTRNRSLIICGCLWLTTLLISMLPLMVSGYFKGQFYSRSAVCLALPLTRDKPSGWEYGMAIFIIFNFIIFLVIAFGQYLIYREVSIAVDSRIRTQRKNQDMVIARGLFLIVLSDFVCWFPIGVMGLMALFDQVIPGEVYAWTAVFILPINSALNPFLYTFNNIIKRKALTNRDSTKQPLSKSTSMVSTVEQAWTDICNKDLFILGSRSELKLSLSDYLEQTILSVKEIYLIVDKLTESVAFLHERGLVHGSITEKYISLEIEDERRITGVSSKVSPKVVQGEEDTAADIQALGQLTLRLLRSRHAKLLRSTSTQ